jgi:hypothetical protein
LSTVPKLKELSRFISFVASTWCGLPECGGYILILLLVSVLQEQIDPIERWCSVLEIYICKLTRCQIMYPNSAHGHGKYAHGESLFHFRTNARMQWPFCVYFFSLTIKDKTNISLKIKILHLRHGSFTRKVRTIFTLKIIVSIFVKLFLILVLH